MPLQPSAILPLAFLFTACSAPNLPPAATLPTSWPTYTNTAHHFSFRYPPTWSVNPTERESAHYTQTLASLNSLGNPRLSLRTAWIAEHASPQDFLPPGAASLEVQWIDGPGGVAVIGPAIHEMEARDLASFLPAPETTSGNFTFRSLSFDKWGHRWSIAITLHAPVSPATLHDLDRVLASFHFDGIPAGDPLWALTRAVKALPPEADPDHYSRQGGNSEYSTHLEAQGPDVIVTFHKHLLPSPHHAWAFRVTPTGQAIPLPTTAPDPWPAQSPQRP